MKKKPIPDNVKEEVLEIIEEFNRSGSIPRSLLRTFNFEIWKLKCLGACPEDLY